MRWRLLTEKVSCGFQFLCLSVWNGSCSRSNHIHYIFSLFVFIFYLFGVVVFIFYSFSLTSYFSSFLIISVMRFYYYYFVSWNYNYLSFYKLWISNNSCSHLYFYYYLHYTSFLFFFFFFYFLFLKVCYLYPSFNRVVQRNMLSGFFIFYKCLFHLWYLFMAFPELLLVVFQGIHTLDLREIQKKERWCKEKLP